MESGMRNLLQILKARVLTTQIARQWMPSIRDNPAVQGMIAAESAKQRRGQCLHSNNFKLALDRGFYEATVDICFLSF
jgi:hypothetical protein